MNFTNLDYFDGPLMMMNDTVFTEPAKPTGEVVIQHLCPIVYSVAAVLGLIGNLSVIIVVVADTQMWRSVNTLIASLAFVDLVFAVTCLPSSAVMYVTDTWPFINVWCKVSHLQLSTTNASNR